MRLKAACELKCQRLCTNVQNKPSCKSGDLRSDSSWTVLFRHHWQTLRFLPVETKSVSSHLERLQWRRGLDRNQRLIIYPQNVFTRLNATTKTHIWQKWQVAQTCEWQQVIAEFLSRVKKLHTHLLWEEQGKNVQWMHGGGLTPLWRIVQGFVVWKAWEQRGGALTGSLWARESHINCNCHGCQWGFVCSSRSNGGFEFNS